MEIKEAQKIMWRVYTEFYPLLMCSDVCKIFLMIMDSHGIEGRYVALTRPSKNPIQGHSTCEAKFDDKWLCFDVAFNYFCNEPASNMNIDGHPAVINKEYREEFEELYNNREYVNYE